MNSGGLEPYTKVEVAKVFEGVRKLDDLPPSQPDWRALLTDKNIGGGFGPPTGWPSHPE
jgi:hypothetical protein